MDWTVYIIRCDDVIKDAAGNVTELHCTYDADTRSGTGTSDRKVKGTIHWVSAEHAVPASVRLYDRLFTVPNPGKAEDLMSVVNDGNVYKEAEQLDGMADRGRAPKLPEGRWWWDVAE